MQFPDPNDLVPLVNQISRLSSAPKTLPLIAPYFLDFSIIKSITYENGFAYFCIGVDTSR